MKKTNGYSNAKLHAKRQQKRDEAEARNFRWENLTRSEQFASLQSRRGESKRQIARLSK